MEKTGNSRKIPQMREIDWPKEKVVSLLIHFAHVQTA